MSIATGEQAFEHFERLRNPPPHDVFTPLGYEPNCIVVEEARKAGRPIPPRCGQCPQEQLHATPPYSKGGPWDLLFGGAMGGGKTQGLVMDGIDKVVQFPGLETWIVRQTYPDLERDVIPFVEQMGYCVAIGGRWHGGQRTLTFPGRGRIRFLHARNLVDAANIRGQCQYLIVDERTRIDPQVIDTLALRIRSGHSSIPVIGIRSGTNPGGIGHGRIKTDFIDPAPKGRVELNILDEETGRPLRENPEDPDSRVLTRYFLPSSAGDNPHLDPSYYTRFSMMSADARAAYRDGDWTKFEGMRFSDFVMGLHVVSPSAMPLQLEDLDLGKGIDYGSAAPFACIWGALINGGEALVVYRELHEPGLTPTKQGELVVASEQETEHGTPAYVDPSTWARNPEQPTATGTNDRPPPGSIAYRYLEAGIAVRKAHNDRLTGWAAIEDLIRLDEVDVEGPGGAEVEVQGPVQRLYVYDTCPNLIRSLTNAPRDPKNPEDVDGAYRDDHALDAFRYLVMGLMGGPAREPQLLDTGARAAAARVSTGVR